MGTKDEQGSQSMDQQGNRAADNGVIDNIDEKDQTLPTTTAGSDHEGTISETDGSEKKYETVNFVVDDPDNPHNWSFVSFLHTLVDLINPPGLVPRFPARSRNTPEDSKAVANRIAMAFAGPKILHHVLWNCNGDKLDICQFRALGRLHFYCQRLWNHIVISLDATDLLLSFRLCGGACDSCTDKRILWEEDGNAGCLCLFCHLFSCLGCESQLSNPPRF